MPSIKETSEGNKLSQVGDLSSLSQGHISSTSRPALETYVVCEGSAGHQLEPESVFEALRDPLALVNP